MQHLFKKRKPSYKYKAIILYTFIFLIILSLFSNSQRNIVLNYLASVKTINFVIKLDGSDVEYCNPILSSQNSHFRVKIDDREYPHFLPQYYNKSLDFQCLNSSSQQAKKILMWNNFVGLPIIKYGFGGREVFESLKCPVTNCELTKDKSKIEESDLILFHLRSHLPEWPLVRLPHQRWVHVIFESPVHCSQCEKFENTFNLSTSYNSESDFTSIYLTDSGLFWDEPSVNHTFTDVFSTKTDFAVALISDCGARSPRLQYIRALQKHVQVNLYGKCGSKCPTDLDCRQHVASKHKFFLAFENSFCRDYVTEKFLDTLRYDIIPVVFGDGNYLDFAPKSGFINVQDFKTVKDLADYLKYLDGNQTAYNEYFVWKKYLKYDENHPIGGYLCEMCIKLHLEASTGTFETKQFNNLHDKFGLNKNCREMNFNGDNYELQTAKDETWTMYFSDRK